MNEVSKPACNVSNDKEGTDYVPLVFVVLMFVAFATVSLSALGPPTVREALNGYYTHRVGIDKLRLNTPLTDALRHTNGQLPADVSDLRCWFLPPVTSGTSTAHLACDAILRGRAITDFGSDKDRWYDIIYPIHDASYQWKFDGDIVALRNSKFNFLIRRGQEGLDVLTNLDPRKLTFQQASSVVNTTVSRFNHDEQKRLNAAQAAATAPERNKASWPNSAGEE